MFGERSVTGSALVEPIQKYSPIFHIEAFFAQFTLALKFLLAATFIILAGMITLGCWVSARIENAVVQNSATSIAFSLRSTLEPWKTYLDTSHTVSPEIASALDRVLMNNSVTAKPTVIKIWARDGTIIYSSRVEIRGKKLAVPDSLASAFAGQVASEFDDLTSDENVLERSMFTHFLEIYVPISLTEGGKVVAVAEMYQAADQLAYDIKLSQMESAVILALLSAIMILVLYTIVGPASRTLVSQRHRLSLQVDELNRLLQTKQALQQQIIVANQNVMVGQDRLLSRVSADIHDGPVQLISLALMNASKVHSSGTPQLNNPVICKINEYLNEALAELRKLATDLSLPDLTSSDLQGVLQKAVSHHVVCTNSSVDVEIHDNLPTISGALGHCLYRFVQESLMNSFRHAQARSQRVTAKWLDDVLCITVSDAGPGFDPTTHFAEEKLGLWGLRCRITSLGGHLEIFSQPGVGTTLQATFKLVNVEVTHG